MLFRSKYGWQIIAQFEGQDDYYAPPFWWRKLLKDPNFRSLVHQRWRSYRAGPLSDAAVEAEIDDVYAHISPALSREFTTWDRLRQYDWPNVFPIPSWATSTTDTNSYTYADHLAYLKAWLFKRLAWMDSDEAWKAMDDWGEAQN